MFRKKQIQYIAVHRIYGLKFTRDFRYDSDFSNSGSAEVNSYIFVAVTPGGLIDELLK